jgi:hypothetical protein
MHANVYQPSSEVKLWLAAIGGCVSMIGKEYKKAL